MIYQVEEAWTEFAATIASLIVVLQDNIKRKSLADAVVLLAVEDFEHHLGQLTVIFIWAEDPLCLADVLVVELLKALEDVALQVANFAG